VFLDTETRRMMGEQAVSLAKSVEYTSAGRALAFYQLYLSHITALTWPYLIVAVHPPHLW